MKTKPPADRLRAGEVVRFSELSKADLRALFPRFDATWRAVTQVTRKAAS